MKDTVNRRLYLLAVFLFLSGCASTRESVYRWEETRDVPRLIKALKDKDDRTRYIAAGALGKIGDKNALYPLIETLKDNDADVRAASAESLGKMGLQAREAVPALLGALKDNSRNVRFKAARAIARMEPQPNEILPIINEAREAKDAVSRAKAVYVLGEFGAVEGVIPALISALQDTDPRVAMEAAIALSGVGPKAKEAIPALTEAAKAAEGLELVGEYEVIRDNNGVIMSHAIPVYTTGIGIKLNYVMYSGSDERGPIFYVLDKDNRQIGRGAYSRKDVAILAAVALQRISNRASQN
jgi:hypothetical protein